MSWAPVIALAILVVGRTQVQIANTRCHYLLPNLQGVRQSCYTPSLTFGAVLQHENLRFQP